MSAALPPILNPQVPAPPLGRGFAGQSAQNSALMALYNQTQDPTILAYIQSGWTTPVSAAVQAQVSQIVGRDVPIAPPANGPAGGVTENFGVPPAPAPVLDPGQQRTGLPQPETYGTAGPGGFAASPGAPAYASSPTTLPSGGTPVPDPGFDLTAFWGGGNQRQQTAPVGSPFPGKDVGQGGAAGGAVEAAERAAAAAQAGVAAGVRNAGQQSRAGTTTVPAKTTVAAGGNPAGGAGAVDPNSAVGQGGYAAAMGGDQTALNAVLGTVLKRLGVDVTRPGLYTGSLVDEIQPYLQTYLRYFGLDNGKPALDRAREAAGNFGNMLGSAGTFGQLQDYGRSLVGKTGLLDDLFNRDSTTPQRQMGMANDLLGLLSAGNNQVLQSSDRADMLAGRQRYAQEALEQPGLKYSDYLKNQPQAALGLLAALLGG